jgi:hypothetical protein
MMARLAFSHFFAPNGLPKLVIMDGGSEFKGVLITMCDQIGIQHCVAAPEAHNAILCECFHRCSNKVEKIGAADAQSYEQWAMNALFAACAWNGSPVDGTDAIRSFAAKARTVHFPLDVQTDDEVARLPQLGEATTQHIETMFPLWFRQKELLKLLNDEQRTGHGEMADEGRKKRTFQPGDLVQVRKQVKSNAAEGKPAKLTLKARGLCRMLEGAGENLHWMQKIPAVQSLTRRPGKRNSNANGKTVIINGNSQESACIGQSIGRNERSISFKPIGKKSRFLRLRKLHKGAGDADFAFKKNQPVMEPRRDTCGSKF